MRTVFLIITTLLSFVCNAVAAPLYTDEIPVSHLTKVQSIKDKRPEVENLDTIPKENKIKIYSTEKRRLEGKDIIVSSYMNSNKVIKKKNYRYKNGINLYDKVDFITSEDTYKNGIIFIKKGAIVTGTVTTGTFPRSDQDIQQGELGINQFKTKDVNGNTVYLYGDVTSRSPDLADLSGIIAFSPCIPKNKIYTLYFK